MAANEKQHGSFRGVRLRPSDFCDWFRSRARRTSVQKVRVVRPHRIYGVCPPVAGDFRRRGGENTKMIDAAITESFAVLLFGFAVFGIFAVLFIALLFVYLAVRAAWKWLADGTVNRAIVRAEHRAFRGVKG